MTQGDGQRVCIRLGCTGRGQPTDAERCPACEFMTQPLSHYRPDPDGYTPFAAQPPNEFRSSRMGVLIVTMNEVPGYSVTRVHGDVFGLTVRARDYFSNVGARLRTVVGGEVSGYSKMLSEARAEARERLAEETKRVGGNAVIAMRFDCSEIGGIMNEIVAYGTAVTLEKTATSPTATPREDLLPH